MAEVPYQRTPAQSQAYNPVDSAYVSHPDVTLSATPHDLSRAFSPARFDSAVASYPPAGSSSEETGLQRIGKAIFARVAKAARRGNLPFIVVFIGCLGIFFSALAGIGYVDPDMTSPVPAAAAFMPGAPVFDPIGDTEIARRRKADERRELEEQWQKKRRPQDGAWMQKQRDDKAIRRKPISIPPPSSKLYDELDKRATPDSTAGSPAQYDAEVHADAYEELESTTVVEDFAPQDGEDDKGQ